MIPCRASRGGRPGQADGLHDLRPDKFAGVATGISALRFALIIIWWKTCHTSQRPTESSSVPRSSFATGQAGRPVPHCLHRYVRFDHLHDFRLAHRADALLDHVAALE
jgi:hypothetical protein